VSIIFGALFEIKFGKHVPAIKGCVVTVEIVKGLEIRRAVTQTREFGHVLAIPKFVGDHFPLTDGIKGGMQLVGLGIQLQTNLCDHFFVVLGQEGVTLTSWLVASRGGGADAAAGRQTGSSVGLGHAKICCQGKGTQEKGWNLHHHD